MKLIYGTKNLAKIDMMQKAVKDLPIEIIGLDAFAVFPNVKEVGNSPLENARIKVQEYYKILQQPIFSCDSGLYIDGKPDELSPGVYIRRVNGKELSDQEMIEYYTGLAAEAGGKVKARYRNAISIIINDILYFENDDEDLASEEFYITDKPHDKINPGFPLDSISLEIESGKYHYDIKGQKNKETKTMKGFHDFFMNLLANNMN